MPPSVVQNPGGNGGAQTLSSGEQDVCSQFEFDVEDDCVTVDTFLSASNEVLLSLACFNWPEFGANVMSQEQILFRIVNANSSGDVIAEVSVQCQFGIDRCTAPAFPLPVSGNLSLWPPTPQPTIDPILYNDPRWLFMAEPNYPISALQGRAVVRSSLADIFLQGDIVWETTAEVTPSPTPRPVITVWGQPRTGRDGRQGEECHPQYLDLAGNVVNEGFRWWRVMTHEQNMRPRPRFPGFEVDTTQPGNSHHPIQNLWVETIFEDVYARGDHYDRGPTVLMPRNNHSRANEYNLLTPDQAMDQSWSSMWNENDFAAYPQQPSGEEAEIDSFSSRGFRMFSASQTPRRCVELYKERLKSFMKHLVCIVIIEGFLSTAPPQVTQVRVWVENELGETLNEQVCRVYLGIS